MLCCVRGIWIAVAAVFVLGCSDADSRNSTRQRESAPTSSTSVAPASPKLDESSVGPVRFIDVAKAAGIRFSHYSPLTEQRHVHLVMGSGLGWFDADRDGWPDLYCCQGASFTGDANEEARGNVLFRNHEGTTFSDITREAGLLDTGYSMGIASADYDNDGFADLCVTGYQANTLLHNNGDGTFSKVEMPRQSAPGRLSASCAWGDIDADGNLDLYIANYAKLGPEDYPICETAAGDQTVHIACHPNELTPMPDLLFHNTGDGEFVEISKAAGILAGASRQGLGIIAADLDRDGDTDFYVANDTTPNYLWENQGDGQFIDRGSDSGTSTNRYGSREASMGVAVGDVDGNGQLDLFVTNFYNETNTLYRNQGSLLFADVSNETGLGAPSRLRLGFGASFVDFDNDGWLDLLTANGHIHDRLHEIGRDGSFAQLAQVFRNEQGARFRDISSSAGQYFREPHVGRGTAIADFDRDGDADVAISHLNDEAALLRNDVQEIRSWLRIELVGITSNRDSIGAAVEIDLGDRILMRTVQAGGSYLGCDERAMLIGLGALDEVREITVVWPGGRRESWNELKANRLWRLFEGSERGSSAR